MRSLEPMSDLQNVSAIEDRPVTVKTAARFLGVSPSLVYAYVERKQIPHYRMMGRSIRFRLSELDAWRQQFLPIELRRGKLTDFWNSFGTVGHHTTVVGNRKALKTQEERWSGRGDLNSGPPAPEAGALPGCATPRGEECLLILQCCRELVLSAARWKYLGSNFGVAITAEAKPASGNRLRKATGGSRRPRALRHQARQPRSGYGFSR